MPYAEKNSRDFKRFMIRPLHLQNVKEIEGQVPDLYFNSIITEFSDSWTPRWNSVNVYGRMDPLPFYGGTSRELVFGFRVISDSAIEAKKNMAKIQKLIQYQYPLFSYEASTKNRQVIEGSQKNFIQAPPYFELEFLNLFKSGKNKVLKGYINGPVQINPGFQTKDQAQYFSLDFSEIYFSDVTVTLRFQVLHDVDVIGVSKTSQDYPYGINQAIADNLSNYAVNPDGVRAPPPSDSVEFPETEFPSSPKPKKTEGKPPSNPDKRASNAATRNALRPQGKK